MKPRVRAERAAPLGDVEASAEGFSRRLIHDDFARSGVLFGSGHPIEEPTGQHVEDLHVGITDDEATKFAGCDAYLTKPTRMQEFLNTLREFAIAGKLSRP